MSTNRTSRPYRILIEGKATRAATLHGAKVSVGRRTVDALPGTPILIQGPGAETVLRGVVTSSGWMAENSTD